MGNAGILRMAGDQSEPNLQMLREIEDAARQAGVLTDQLLTFGGKGTTDAAVCPRNALNNVSDLLRTTEPPGAQIITEVDQRVGLVPLDYDQWEQVVRNLAFNACDAIRGEGTVRIQLSVVKTANRGAQEKQDSICLTVSDDGVGMTEETRLRIYEPFFTTKTREKGTGLGLAAVHGIVNQAGGWIYIESEYGVGTTAKVTIPAIARRPEAA